MSSGELGVGSGKRPPTAVGGGGSEKWDKRAVHKYFQYKHLRLQALAA